MASWGTLHPQNEPSLTHLTDASLPQTVVGPACTPLSNQGATTETTQVTRSARSRFDLISLSESESQTIPSDRVLEKYGPGPGVRLGGFA